MAKRGRPRKNGIKDPMALFRALAVLEAFHRARAAKKGYAVAVHSAMQAVRNVLPKMKISRSEVNRILNNFNPSNQKDVFLVERSDKVRLIKIAPRPVYKRKAPSAYPVRFSKRYVIRK